MKQSAKSLSRGWRQRRYLEKADRLEEAYELGRRAGKYKRNIQMDFAISKKVSEKT
jgi:hypothetical protein